MANPLSDPHIFIALNPVEPKWELGDLPVSKGAMALLGWNVVADDGGVPTKVANAIVQGLCRDCRLIFPSSISNSLIVRTQAAEDQHLEIAVRLDSGFDSPLSVFRKRKVCLICTSSFGTALCLFDDEVFSWPMRSQFALLSQRGFAPEADLLARYFTIFVEDDWSAISKGLLECRSQAILRPGVDGAVAGLFCVSAEIRSQLIGQLVEAGQSLGIGIKIVSEGDFASSI